MWNEVERMREWGERNKGEGYRERDEQTKPIKPIEER
jgi:hypothetical protein